NEVKYLYKLELSKKFIVSEKLYFFNPNKALVFKRSTDEEKQLTTIEFGNKIKVKKIQKANLEANTLWNNTVLGGFSKTNFDSFELKECLEWFGENLKPLITSNTILYNFLIEKIEKKEI